MEDFFIKKIKTSTITAEVRLLKQQVVCKKASKRKLINEEANIELRKLFGAYFKLINGYIKSIGTASDSNELHEEEVIYETSSELENFLTNDDSKMTNDLLT